MTTNEIVVKICGVTSEKDAEFIASSGATALGLIYAESPRHVRAEVATRITRGVTGVWRVGVFRHQSDQEILAVTDRDELDIAQLHDPASSALLLELRQRGINVWRAVSISNLLLSEAESRSVDAVLVDGPRPGSGVVNDWTRFSPTALGRRFVAAGGLAPDNVAQVIGQLSPWAVDVASGVESAPGVKDYEKVANFVAAARMAHFEKGAQ